MSSTTDLLRGYFRFFRNKRASFAGLLCLDGMSAGIEMIPPLFSILIFDYAFPQQNLMWLAIALGGGFAAYLLHFAISSWAEYLNSRLDNQMNVELSTSLFHRIANAPLRFYQKLKMGDLTVRLTDDTDVITGLLLNLPSHLLIALIQLIIFFVIAFILDPWVTVLGIMAIPIYIWETQFYSRRLESTQEELQESDSNLFDGLQEKLVNVRTIKAFNKEVHEKEHIGNLFQQRARLSIRFKLLSLYQTFANSLTLQIWTVLITAYLGFEVIRGALSIGEMISLGIYLPLIQEPISDLAHVWTQVRIGAVSLRRVAEIQDLPEEPQSLISVPDNQMPLSGDIRFENVSFAYNDNKPIIKGLDLTLPCKQMTAIVGPSGIGKSTLTYLLLNMYQPSAGRILCNEKELSEFDLYSLRRQMTVVFQEAALFSGSIRDNICYSRPDAPEEKIIEAARKANAHHFITDLFQGYDTILLPWGGNISVGQRQRIALARALLLNPSLLILDEVTSSLDAEAGFLIEEALEKLRHDMTILLITHQLSAAKKADQILFLDDGHIVEKGTFQELMDQKGPFFDLYNIQTGGFQEFLRRFEIEIERHTRYKEPLSLIIIEPQGFERWKTHEAPELLPLIMETISQEIRRHLRVMDFCSIYTDKRIVVALPQTDGAGAETMIRRLIMSIEKERFPAREKTFQSKFSFGIGACGADELTYSEQLFLKAEADLEK